MTLNRDLVKQKAKALGFHKFGIASADADLAVHYARLQTWLDRGFQADMGWMSDLRRQNIQQVMPGVRSLICVALNYYTPHSHSQDPRRGKISRYGWGRDYHRVLGKRLRQLSDWLRDQGENVQTKFYVDTGPLSEKAWAEQAGLGWVAKNSNLITREYGSWVFLGTVLTNLDLAPDRPHTQHCGSCTRCITACPTGAIPEPAVVDANRCIAYHTIENRAESLPLEISTHLQGWVAGCDICQDVCPWNQRFAQPTEVPDFQPYPWNLNPDLQTLAQLSDQDWHQRFPASALRRIKPWMWRRNARANLTGMEKSHQPANPSSNCSSPTIPTPNAYSNGDF